MERGWESAKVFGEEGGEEGRVSGGDIGVKCLVVV
jgi:hypothetical protein